MYPRFLTMCLRMAQFVQITHTKKYVVPFHTKKLFTSLRVNSPSFSVRIVTLFDSMLIQQGNGSGTPTEPHQTPSQEAQPSSPTHIPTSSIPTVIPIPTITQSEPTPLRHYTRRVRIAQSSALLPVADEPASPVRDISKGEACPTDSGFIADQDRATIAKSSTLPYDTAPRVTSPTAVEGNDVAIKGRRIDEEEGITGRVSSDTEEIRMDEWEVAVERTSARELEEQQKREDKRMTEQIARDVKVARIHAEEELQGMIDSLDRTNETIAK
nr:hypothetical protein [Tanacetum cinerariifolium]